MLPLKLPAGTDIPITELIGIMKKAADLYLNDALPMGDQEQTPDDFARYHPGGRIGKKVVTVGHLMHGGGNAPIVGIGVSMRDAIRTISEKRLGMTCVVHNDGRLAGVITDGDLRRHLGRGDDLLRLTVDVVMTRDPVTIGRQDLAVSALNLLETRKITSLVVVDQENRVEGVVHIHDLWRTQLF